MRTPPRAALLACWGLAAPAAHAWTLDELHLLELPAPASEVQLVTVRGRVLLAAVGPESTALVDPQSGELLGSLSRGGSDVLGYDLDGDGVSELVHCGDEGVGLIPLHGAALAEPVPLSATPCLSIEALRTEPVPSVVLAGPSGATLLRPVRGRVSEVPLRMEIQNAPLLAAHGQRLAVAGAGARTFLVRHGSGTSTLDAGGPIEALAALPSGWLWATGGALHDTEGHVLALGSEVVALQTPDLDGDAGPEVAALLRDGTLVWTEPGAKWHGRAELPWPASALAGGDIDGDGCGDLVVVASEAPAAVWVEGACERPTVPDVPAPPTPRTAPTEAPVPELLRDGDTAVSTSTRATWVFEAGVPARVGVRHARPRGKGVHAWGGAPGLALTQRGTLSFAPGPDDVGRWNLALTYAGFFVRDNTYVTIAVVPAGGGPPTAEALAALPARTLDPSEPWDFRHPNRSRLVDTGLHVGSCTVVGGGAVGLSQGGGRVSWEDAGQPPLQVTGSPAGGALCTLRLGGRVDLFSGFDSALLAIYVMSFGRQQHVLTWTSGVQYRVGTLLGGPYATIGSVNGMGARLAWLAVPLPDGAGVGLETRLTALLPTLAGEASLMLAVELPNPRNLHRVPRR